MRGIEVLFVAGFGPVIIDVDANLRLFRDTLGLPLSAGEQEPDYFSSGKIDGVKHFAMWPLYRAALSCFGKPEWPGDVPAPTSWIEFDVEDVAGATKILEDQGYRCLVRAREEPWGQTVTRLLSPEGVLVGVTMTPFLRK